MPPTSPVVPASDPQVAGVCGECGAVVGSVTLHTAWHAGADRLGEQATVVAFLDQVDPQALSQAALEHDPTGDPIAGALEVLKRLAAER